MSVWLLAAGTASAMACGDSSSGDNGSAEGGTGSNVGNANGKGCGKGDYPSTGETIVCNEGRDCVSPEAVEGYERIYGNFFYTEQDDLTPLRCLQETGELILGGLSVENLDALKNLTGVAKISLLKMPNIRDFSGLSNVGKLNWFNFVDTALAEVRGMPPIEVKFLSISKAAELTSLAGFEPLKITGEILIDQNPKLPQCEVDRFVARYPGVKVTTAKNEGTGTCD